jgi:hypothetical protein
LRQILSRGGSTGEDKYVSKKKKRGSGFRKDPWMSARSDKRKSNCQFLEEKEEKKKKKTR